MSDETCWTLIRSAAEEDSEAREHFVGRYLPILKRYFEGRWRGSAAVDVDDALQEVFIECFKDQGVLEQAAQGRVSNFRAFLHGVARNVASRMQKRHVQRIDRAGSQSFHADEHARDEDRLTVLFDRSWAQGIMRQAAELHAERATQEGPEAERGVRLLDLRIREGKPIREIAQLWGEDAGRLHHLYARAREQFGAALRSVVAFHHPGSPEAVDGECRRLTELLR